MRLTCYLIVSHTGSVSVRKSRPYPGDIKPGHLVLPLTVTIPQSAFALYLQSVEVNVPESETVQAAVKLTEDTNHAL